MKRSLLPLLLALTALFAPGINRAQSADADDWTYHLAYRYAEQCAPANGRVYALFAGNLLEYRPEDQYSTQLTRAEGLSGKGIADMAYCKAEDCLVVVYSDFNVDLIFADGEVVNIPQLKNGNDGSATFADLTLDNDMAIIATTKGIALVDIARTQFMQYFQLDRNVASATLNGRRLYAATTEGIITCSLDGNPLDMTQWTSAAGLKAAHLYSFAEGVFARIDTGSGVAAADVGLWYMTYDEDEKTAKLQQVLKTPLRNDAVDATGATFLAAKRAYRFATDNPYEPQLEFEAPEKWIHAAADEKGNVWTAEGFDLIRNYRIGTDGKPGAGEHVAGGFGPRRDMAYRMHYAGERLIVAGGRIDFVSGRTFPGTAMLREQNGEWRHLQDEDIPSQYNVRFRDVTSVLQDPDDPDHHFVTTATGLYEFKDLKAVHHYSKNNSMLQPAASTTSPSYIFTDALVMDKNRNLIMTNGERDTTLKVMLADGSWCGIVVDELKRAQSCEKAIIDNAGRLWVGSRRTQSKPRHTSGLLCLDYGGTPADTDDDVSTYRSTAYNQDGAACDLQYVYEIVQDSDGRIWMGCASGLYVIDPEQWNQTDFRITQIKVPRNDGTNLADYLLAEVPVSAIAIDGGGRKWIGTLSSGIYLVSPTGEEILAHYTTGNSPLLDDCVYSLAIDPGTGEVMIGTEAGICSVRSGASQPADRLTEDGVTVYPNPVRPEYRGSLTVKGLTLGADVKIVTASGQAVAGGTSQGGTFTWNCRRNNGERVASGVYYIMVSTADGKEGVAAKVVII